MSPCSYISEFKCIEKTTYRDFIYGMNKVLQFIIEEGRGVKGYAVHMSFITSKATRNLYVTDALIKYELAVTDKVILGELPDWVSADPESAAIHLGADATYAVRGAGKQPWHRGSSGTSGSTRVFSDWPREVCWLYNNTSCYFNKCRRAHICVKCRKTGHTPKECENNDAVTGSGNDERRTKPTQNETQKK